MCTEFGLEVESSTWSPLNAAAVVFASSHNFGGKWCLASLLSAHNLTASFKELLQLTSTVTKLTSGGPQGIMFYQILTKVFSFSTQFPTIFTGICLENYCSTIIITFYSSFYCIITHLKMWFTLARQLDHLHAFNTEILLICLAKLQ